MGARKHRQWEGFQFASATLTSLASVDDVDSRYDLRRRGPELSFGPCPSIATIGPGDRKLDCCHVRGFGSGERRPNPPVPAAAPCRVEYLGYGAGRDLHRTRDLRRVVWIHVSRRRHDCARWGARPDRAGISLVPPPIVMAMVAGAILPYVAGIFSALPGAPTMVGGAFAANILGRRFLPARVPAVLLAIAAGILGAAVTGKLHMAQFDWAPPVLQFTAPAFSWVVLIAYAPVLAVLMTASSNLASVVYIRNQRYRPPTRLIDVATGSATGISHPLDIRSVSARTGTLRSQ